MERKLPIAFSIITHGHLGILEAQLATLFKPHNAYCIYIDKKASQVVYMSSSFWLLTIGSHALFHAKYKIAACKAEQIHKVTTTTTTT